MAIKIYLDTQDYSKFADATVGKSTKEVLDVYEELVRRSLAGQIEFYYSLPILSELLQYDERNKELTLRKAKIVSELCGQNCLRHPKRILVQEYNYILHSHTDNRESLDLPTALSQEGQWYPSISEHFKTMKLGLETAVLEKLNDSKLTRKARRTAAKQIRNKSFLRQQITAPSGIAMIESQLKDYPGLSLQFVTRYLGSLGSEITPQEIETEFFQPILSPENFVIWYYEKTNKSDFPTWMRSFGEKLISLIENTNAKLIQLIEEAGLADHKKILNMVFEDFHVRTAIDFLDICSESTEIIVNNSLENKVEGILTNSQPEIIKVLSDIARLYAYDNVLSHRQIRASDGGDIMHAAYIPYIDIWRSDRYFANLMRGSEKTYDTAIVSKLKNLVPKIDELAAKS